jgi:hypothetical protein
VLGSPLSSMMGQWGSAAGANAMSSSSSASVGLGVGAALSRGYCKQQPLSPAGSTGSMNSMSPPSSTDASPYGTAPGLLTPTHGTGGSGGGGGGGSGVGEPVDLALAGKF